MDGKPNYYYDEKLNLNLINIGDQIIPYIKAPQLSAELLTKTRIERESDENAESLTKTCTDREQDDHDPYMFLDVFTKTKIARESDD